MTTSGDGVYVSGNNKMKNWQKKTNILPVVFNCIMNYFIIFQVAKIDASLLFNINFVMARTFK